MPTKDIVWAWGERPTPRGSKREKTSPLGKKGEGVSAFGVGRADREACFPNRQSTGQDLTQGHLGTHPPGTCPRPLDTR